MRPAHNRGIDRFESDEAHHVPLAQLAEARDLKSLKVAVRICDGIPNYADAVMIEN